MSIVRKSKEDVKAKLRAVSLYVELGWPLTLSKGKEATDLAWQEHPLGKEEIERRLVRSPSLNVGVILGPGSGLIDFDVDSLQGEEDFRRLFAGGRIPETPAYRSKRGRHRIFRFHDQLERIGGATFNYGALEVRVGANGRAAQAILPPSITGGHRKRWTTSPASCKPARLPKRVLDRLVESVSNQARVRQQDDGSSIPKHERNSALASLAGTMRRRGMTQGEIDAAIQAVNKGRCTPPLPASEVAGIARSVAGYTPLSSDVSSFTSFNSYTPGAEWPVLDQAAMQGPAGEIIGTIEPATEADPVALLGNLLVAFGNLIGPGPHCLVEHDHHPARFNILLVGETSKARKGMSLSALMHLLSIIAKAWLEGRILSGLSTGEGLVKMVQDKLKVDKEKDGRLLVLEPEFARVLTVIGREGNTLSHVIRQAWDDGNLSVATRNEPLQARGAHISILGHVTRQELAKYLGRVHVASGFGNRFLYLLVRRSKCLPDGGSPPPSDLVRIRSLLAKAVNFAKRIKKLRRDDEARELWHAIYPSLSEGKPGLVGAVTSRAEAQVLRLSLAYTLLDRCRKIKREHLEAALALWKYGEQSARIIFGKSTGNLLADRIYRFLADGPLTSGEINDRLSRNTPAEQIKEAVEVLEKLGWIIKEKQKTGGRPRTVWTPTPGTNYTN